MTANDQRAAEREAKRAFCRENGTRCHITQTVSATLAEAVPPTIQVRTTRPGIRGPETCLVDAPDETAHTERWLERWDFVFEYHV